MLCVIGNMQAQEKHLGVLTGIVYYNHDNTTGSNSEIEGLIGFRAEYHPNKAFFSAIVGIQYISGIKYFQVPLTLNLLIGNILKFKIIGGVVPTFRLSPLSPNKTLVVGGQLGIGFEYKINNKYVVYSEFTGYIIPGLENVPSHNGGENIIRKSESIASVSIGVKYQIARDTR
jgi:hypothetical protein